jgi:hypothetical protein
MRLSTTRAAAMIGSSGGDLFMTFSFPWVVVHGEEKPGGEAGTVTEKTRKIVRRCSLQTTQRYPAWIFA